jgi:type VI protein secretion system component Hcp
MPPSSIGQFQAWRAGGSAGYPISVQPITFTRGIDRTSTVFLHHCIKSESFDSASLVKRKASGGNISGEPYLRLDFSSVLITNVSWSNDEPVQETVQFISRAITVRYRPQLPDGTLGAIIQKFYPMNPQEKEEIL